MNNNYNPNNQYGGWAPYNGQYAQYPPSGNGYNTMFGMPNNNLAEKNNDKKILRTMGNLFGGAVIAFIALSMAVSFAIGLISTVFPKAMMLFGDQIANDAYGIVSSILFIGAPFLLAYAVLKKKKYAGILPMGTAYNRKAAVYIVMMMLPVMIISTLIINIVSFNIQNMLGITFTSGIDMTVKGFSGTAMCVISMAVVPALVEEIAIRGVIMQPLRRYGDKFAIVASAMIFSLLHGNMVQIPYTLVAGIYFGYIAVATGSIWPTIVLHFLNNLYSAVIISTDGNFGETAANGAMYAMLAAMIVTGIIGAVLFFRMRYTVKLANGVETFKTSEKVTALFGTVPMVIAIIIMIILTSTSVSFNG